MGNRLALLALILTCFVVAGCASKKKAAQEPDPTVVQYQKFRQNYDAALAPDLDEDLAFDSGTLPQGDSATTDVVLKRAHKAIGTPYVYGGTKPGGFDCSGLVQWAYKGAGIKLPRTAREQSQAGYRIKDRSQMRAGDIVAFKRRRGGYHTGIYLGDGKFIHAPRTNKRVRIESMETGYFAQNFIGARRVNTGEANMELVEATARQDQQYEAELAAARTSHKRVASRVRAKSSSYTVRSGDTLSAVAAKNGTTVKAIVAANNLKDAHSLRIGQKLTIPGKASVSSVKSKSSASNDKPARKSGTKAGKSKAGSDKSAGRSGPQASNDKSVGKSGTQSRSTRHIEVRQAKKVTNAKG